MAGAPSPPSSSLAADAARSAPFARAARILHRNQLYTQRYNENVTRGDVLHAFHPAVAEWFRASFERPTPPQVQGWPAIARGDSTLILAPTGSGKTLTAFLWCINRLMFEPPPAPKARCRVIYISPLKALAVDIERNLRAPLAGIGHRAVARSDGHHVPVVAIRTGDTPAAERARFQREPADILITTPESLYLLLTSNAREALRSIDTVIVDEIHALVPTKRGAHLALSLERLEELTARIQRIGLSATQRPLDEVARFLGGTAEGRAPERPERGDDSRRARAHGGGAPSAPRKAGQCWPTKQERRSGRSRTRRRHSERVRRRRGTTRIQTGHHRRYLRQEATRAHH